MPRDLLAALRSIQSEQSEDHEGPEYGQDVVSIEMERFCPQHPLDELEEAWIMLRGLKTQINLVKSEHEKILNTPNPSDKMKKNLELLNDDIKKRLKNIRSSLKSIDKRINEDTRKPNRNASGTEIRIHKSQFAALSRTFKNEMEEYHTTQLDHRDRIKGRLKRQMAIFESDTTDEKLDEMLEKGDFTTFSQNIVRDTATEEAREWFEAVKTRRNEFLQIENTLSEIRDLFVELAMLVENQGELIDRIETYVEKTRDEVDNAACDMREAAEKKRSARKRKICIYITITTIILIVLLVLVISFVM